MLVTNTCHHSKVAIALVALFFFVAGSATDAQQNPASAPPAQLETTDFGDDQTPICDEVPLPQDPTARQERLAKNQRYSIPPGEVAYIEHVWPSTPSLPTDESALIAVCTVIRVQTYLSGDALNSYTEYSVVTEQILKFSGHSTQPAVQHLVVDRDGGTVRRSDGTFGGNGSSICYLGTLRTGGRYLVFAQPLHHGKDLDLIRGYDLSGGKVTRLVNTGAREDLGNESGLLDEVREKLAQSKTGSN